jgi:3-hydroxybutyryl-CoA dehydrogenase
MKRIGVVGAGVMGAGIAQVAAQSGLEVLLYDIAEEPLKAGLGRVEAALQRQVDRGKLSPPDKAAILQRIETTTTLGDFLGVEFAVEAAPEVMDLKMEIFRTLDRICAPGVVLATNTSSLSVTEIGALTGRPDRVCGLHFFNPVPAMKLVEVVSGARTSPETLKRTTDLAHALGKTAVSVRDTPGFIVNRIARPFPGEALRLLGDCVAGVRQIDRAAKLAAGFRMGPFELMDLVGMDINYAVNRSVFEQFFYEPRFRPNPLQSQMVKAGLLGRKSGAGWYHYKGDQPTDGPEGAIYFGKPGPRVADLQSVCIVGDDTLAELARTAGYNVVRDDADLVLVEASLVATTESALRFPHPERVVGFGGIPAVAQRQLVEVAPGLRTAPEAWHKAAQFFWSLGRDTEVIHDVPGLIAPRLIACVINEAVFVLQEGVARMGDIDTAMQLGVNYPHGPLEWADRLGPATVLAILEHLRDYTGEDRYRPCPLLRKVAQAGIRFGDGPQ